MPSWFLFPFSMLLIIGEAVGLALFGWEQFTLQLGLAIVIVLGVTRDFVSGGFIVAALLYPIEWTVSGLPGYYAFALIGVFFALRPIRGRMTRIVGFEAVIIGAVAAFVHAIMMIITLALTQPNTPIIRAIAENMWISIVTVAFSTLAVAWMFDKITRRFKPIRGDQLEIDI